MLGVRKNLQHLLIQDRALILGQSHLLSATFVSGVDLGFVEELRRATPSNGGLQIKVLAHDAAGEDVASGERLVAPSVCRLRSPHYRR